MTETTKKKLPDWLPFVVGGLLVVQFAALCAWQISRGFEKLDKQRAFDDAVSATEFHHGLDVRPYQALSVSGSWLGDRQLLLDNIIINSRYGYYVITPLDIGAGAPLLLVNRGWIEKAGVQADVAELRERTAISADAGRLIGRVGSLPKAGMRMGEPVAAPGQWPAIAVYPKIEEVAALLGRPVQPFVLLLEPGEEGGFLRHWEPAEMGPGKHFGYAFQWFAMGAVLAGLLIWHYRRRSHHG